jgi:hypothetical protein
MHRRRGFSTLVAVVIVAGIALPACKKKQPDTAGAGGAGGTEVPAKHETPPPEKKAAPSTGCALQPRIEADVTVTKGCALSLSESVNVVEGATLTIEPGAKLSFGPEAYVWISHGRLVAKGTAEAPIVFTSASKSPAAGDWAGIGLDAQTLAGTVLDHVVVEHAGRKGQHGSGAITVVGGNLARRITITNSTIRKNEQVGVHNTGEDSGFAKFEGNTLEENPASIHVSADVLGSVGANKLGTPLEVEGTVSKTASWPAVTVPILVTDSVRIGGEKTAAILTIAPKTTLKFTMNTFLEVGTSDGGGLVAKKVTFTTSNATPAAGDWVGIFFDDKATGSVLEGCTISYAGREDHSGKGAITFHDSKPGPGVQITKTTFSNNKQAAISSDDGDCGDLAKDESENKSEGVPLCAPKE